MGEGVAVCFRDIFGKPSSSDYCDEYVTCQRKPNEATVFSLVTKSQFFEKPEIDIYNTAFTNLTKQFKQLNLHTFICSPLGCVRDCISLHHFAEEIIKFQESTGAAVKIVLYDEITKRKLRRGLTHNEFLIQLQEAIVSKSVSGLSLPLHHDHTDNTSTQRLSTPPGLQVPALPDDININPELASSDELQFPSTPPSSSPVVCVVGGDKQSNVGNSAVISGGSTSDNVQTSPKQNKTFLALSQLNQNLK